MDEAGDIVGIAVPFTASVFASAVVLGGSGTAPGAGVIPIVGFLSLSCAALLMWSLGHQGWPRCKVALLMAFCGVFCYCAALERGVSMQKGPVMTLAGDCVSALRSVIDSMDFDDSRCGPLLKALLTGDRSCLPAGVKQAFRRSGASHLLALSGLHLGFIYLIVRRISRIFPWRGPLAGAVRAVVVIVFCGFYTLMVGAGPSIVRALLFVCVSEVSGVLAGRRRSAGRTLLCALTVQLVMTPLVVTSVGFQLSYMAMAGIIWIYPHFEAWWPRAETSPGQEGTSRAEGKDFLPGLAFRGRAAAVAAMRRLWQAASLSISCQVTTAPLAWHYFHAFPKYFLLTNLLAMPLTSCVMSVSLAAVGLTAAGICPHWLLNIDGRALTALVELLEIISTM